MKCWGFHGYMYRSSFFIQVMVVGASHLQKEMSQSLLWLSFARPRRGSPGHQIALLRVELLEGCNNATQGELKKCTQKHQAS